MRKRDLTKMSIPELVERFTEIGLAQDAADLRDEIAKYNRLFDRMKEVEDELKAREGDQRRTLMPLYEHANPQVRLMAMKATLAVAPKRARRMLNILSESGAYPQAGDAGMCLWSLERGIFIPT